MSTPAPILLFTYKRLDTLKRTVKALQENTLASQSILYIFSDASKKKEDEAIVGSVRSFLRTITGFKKVEIYESEKNQGLANSIIRGVSQKIKIYGKVIVLEDDLETTPNFLAFMNISLNKYENHNKVFSISGYSFNLGTKTAEESDAYFLNRGWSWGWATWKDRWEDVDWAVTSYNTFINDREARSAFALGGSDLNKMLDSQMAGQLDSWAVRWFYHQFRNAGLTLYPLYSKVFNDGFDQNATHTTGSNSRYLPLLDTELKSDFSLPEKIDVNAHYQKQFQKKMGIFSRIISKLETIFQSLFK